jgi:hypothetical protein
VVVQLFDQMLIKQSLEDARKHVKASQPEVEGEASVYLGDLGHFCEESASNWTTPERHSVQFTITGGNNQETLQYLQDASEVYYWELMQKLFLNWRANKKSLSGDVVLRVLNDVKIDVQDRRQRLEGVLAKLEGDQKEDVAPILRGIDARVRVLDGFWDDSTSSIERDEALAAMFDKGKSLSPVVPTSQIATKDTQYKNVRACIYSFVIC